jgi:hypothetical protein
MELSLSSEVANGAATQELPSILWNLKVHYRVHKSPLLVPILSQIDPVHTTPSYPSKSILILSTHLRLDLPSGLFSSGFPINILYAFLFPHSYYMPYPSHPSWLIILILFGDEIEYIYFYEIYVLPENFFGIVNI